VPIAITRDVNTGIGNCELTYSPRVSIDADLAVQQHQEYQSRLTALGCEVISLPTESTSPDSVFIEDTAVVLDNIAVLCRPGAESRQGEVAGVAEVLQTYRPLEAIQPPGTLDGGDLLVVGNVIYAGLSTRSNTSGIEQLSTIVEPHGFSVVVVETAKCLHLKSAVSEVAPGLLLINPAWIEKSAFASLELVDTDEEEAHAANALMVGEKLIYPISFPRTLEKLVKRGIDVSPVDVSELQKAEGAVTCCSLILEPDNLSP